MKYDFIKVLKIIEEHQLDVFTTQSLATHLGVSASGIQNYLETLANNELIRRIEKGKYCRIYIKDKYLIGSKMIERGVVSHQSALAYHELAEDTPGEVFISSSQQKSSKTVFGNHINFIRVRPHKEFGAIEVKGEQGSFLVTDKEKTILDCLDLPKYVSSYHSLVRSIKDIPLRQEKLLEYGFRMNNLSILKRLAYLLDEMLPDAYKNFKEKVRSNLNEKYTLLEPGGPQTGSFSAKWKIRDNMQPQ